MYSYNLEKKVEVRLLSALPSSSRHSPTQPAVTAQPAACPSLAGFCRRPNCHCPAADFEAVATVVI